MTSDLDGAARRGPRWASFDDALRALVARGWRFQQLADAEGCVVVLVGTHGWPGYHDQLHVYGEDEATAARVVTDTRPGINEIVWSYQGDAITTIQELLELPPPHEPSTRWQARRAPLGLWLPATDRPPLRLLPPGMADADPAGP